MPLMLFMFVSRVTAVLAIPVLAPLLVAIPMLTSTDLSCPPTFSSVPLPQPLPHSSVSLLCLLSPLLFLKLATMLCLLHSHHGFDDGVARTFLLHQCSTVPDVATDDRHGLRSMKVMLLVASTRPVGGLDVVATNQISEIEDQIFSSQWQRRQGMGPSTLPPLLHP